MGRRQKPWQGKWIKPILCLETGYKIDKMQNIQPSDALSRVLHFFRAELTDAANFQINLLKKVGHSTLSSPLLSSLNALGDDSPNRIPLATADLALPLFPLSPPPSPLAPPLPFELRASMSQRKERTDGQAEQLTKLLHEGFSPWQVLNFNWCSICSKATHVL